jgi:exopolysaccharide biosynthesis protein
MRSSTFCRLLVTAVLVWRGVALRAEQRVTQPYAGMVYVDRTGTVPRAVHMHIVQVDLRAPGLRFKLSPPAGGREVIRQTTLEFLKQEHAQLAINAHYFLPYPSADTGAWVVGIAASDGRVYSAFESPEQSFALLADAPGVNIDSANHASIVHRDRNQPDGTHVAEPVTLWTTVSGSAQIVTDGAATIPALAWYDAVQARTAIGLSRDGRTLTLFTVDKSGGSEGMQVGEVADLLRRDYGVWNALNLDGGGSTSMALEDPATHVPSLVNTSSDNPAGRAVGSSLAVFARPQP